MQRNVQPTQQGSLTNCSNNSPALNEERTAFLTRNNPDRQLEICGDVDECLFGDYPPLCELKERYGSQFAVAWLVPQLLNLSEYCGCGDKLKNNQLKELAFVISTEWYYLKVSELMLFFHRFKAGRYGRFYGSVDPLVITTALREFVKERNASIERRDMEEKARKRAAEMKDAVTWDEYCKMTGHAGEHPFKQYQTR